MYCLKKSYFLYMMHLSSMIIVEIDHFMYKVHPDIYRGS